MYIYLCICEIANPHMLIALFNRYSYRENKKQGKMERWPALFKNYNSFTVHFLCRLNNTKQRKTPDVLLLLL